MTIGPGMAQSHDYGDKAVYQGQQNALKYLLLEAFCIPTAEQDMDAREPDASPALVEGMAEVVARVARAEAADAVLWLLGRSKCPDLGGRPLTALNTQWQTWLVDKLPNDDKVADLIAVHLENLEMEEAPS